MLTLWVDLWGIHFSGVRIFLRAHLGPPSHLDKPFLLDFMYLDVIMLGYVCCYPLLIMCVFQACSWDKNHEFLGEWILSYIHLLQIQIIHADLLIMVKYSALIINKLNFMCIVITCVPLSKAGMFLSNIKLNVYNRVGGIDQSHRWRYPTMECDLAANCKLKAHTNTVVFPLSGFRLKFPFFLNISHEWQSRDAIPPDFGGL